MAIALVSLGFAFYIFIESAGFPRPHESQLGAAVFPRILAVLLFCFGGLIVLNGRADQDHLEINNLGQVLLSLGILVVYGFVLKTIGFLLATPPFIAALLFVLRVRKTTYLLSAAFGATIVIYGVFRVLLAVPLPEGILGF
jgi:hypothetical protein